MKSIFFSLFFLPFIIFAQDNNQKKIYLDSIWKETTEGNHKYYRIIESYDSQTQLYNIKEYYKSGILQMEGQSKTIDDSKKEGEHVFYYENGSKKSKVNYIQSIKIGKEIIFYENGSEKMELEHFEFQKNAPINFKLNQYWSPNGEQLVINGNGLYDDKGEGYSDSGEIKNGIKEGVWTGEFNKKYKYTEEYKKGVLISGISIDENKKQSKYKILESRPEPQGGIQNFYQYIGKNYIIPKGLESLKGKIVTTFMVNKDGKIADLKTTQSLLELLDQEAIRVISSFPQWTPGKQRGQNVRVLYSIPITLTGNN